MEQISKSFLKCGSWAIINCHHLGVESGWGLWDISDPSEGCIIQNAISVAGRSTIADELVELMLACLPLLQLTGWEEQEALKVVEGAVGQASRWQSCPPSPGEVHVARLLTISWFYSYAENSGFAFTHR